MTDTLSPITEPHLTPMFATGSHPVVSNTQPHPAPIFDTGPHPDPLRPMGADEIEAVVAYALDPEPGPDSALVVLESVVLESVVLESEVLESEVLESEVVESEVVESEVPEPEVLESGVDPGSEPDQEREPDPEPAPFSQAFSELENVDTDAFLRTVNGNLRPVAVPAQPVLVPGSFLFVKRWKFALITAGMWVLAAAAGLGFYYWWYTSLDKTWPVFGILLYVSVTAVASILVTMVPNRPQVTALAIALMAAPMASTAAAAVLHGAYYFEWIARPVMGPVIG